MHAVTYGVSRDQFMARHKANHIQVAYANSAKEADAALLAKAAMADAMGMDVVALRHAEGRQRVVEMPNRMFLHVEKVQYLYDYVIRLRFNDGTEGEVDLKDELYGEVFEPLRDLDQFRRVRVDPETRTVAWENGADFAPEFLFEKMRIPA